jgi:HSP20 family protein
MDVVENDNAYVVKVELPGLSKDDVKVTLQDSVLTVQGEKKHETEEKKSDYHSVERSFGAFRRSFTLDQSVRGEKVDASFKDGILTITIPKTEEIKEEQIDIKVR